VARETLKSASDTTLFDSQEGLGNQKLTLFPMSEWEAEQVISYSWPATYTVPSWAEEYEGRGCNATNPAQIALSADAQTLALFTRSGEFALLAINRTLLSQKLPAIPTLQEPVSLSPSGNLIALSYRLRWDPWNPWNNHVITVYSQGGQMVYQRQTQFLGAVAVNDQGEVAYESHLNEVSFVSRGQIQWTYKLPAVTTHFFGLPDVRIEALKFSDDGKSILVAVDVHNWVEVKKDLARPRPFLFILDLQGNVVGEYQFPGGIGGFKNAFFSAKARTISALSSCQSPESLEHGTLYLLGWNGTILWRRPVGIWGWDYSAKPAPLAMSSDGAYIAYSDGDYVDILSAKDGSTLTWLRHKSVRSLAFQRGYLALSSPGKALLLSLWKPYDTTVIKASRLVDLLARMVGTNSSDASNRLVRARTLATQGMWFEASIEATKAANMASEAVLSVIGSELSETRLLASQAKDIRDPSAIELAKQAQSELDLAETYANSGNYELAWIHVKKGKKAFAEALLVQTESSPNSALIVFALLPLFFSALIILVYLRMRRRCAADANEPICGRSSA